jgi:hypothetical protein
MDLSNKLNGFPKVNFFNLDNRKDRHNWMIKQFNKYGIEYNRVSGTKYLASESSKWKHLIKDINDYKLLVPIAANAITHLEFLKNWHSNTKDPYVLLMEDDYDLNLIDHWHFDWDYLISRLPYDWDCLLMGFENPDGIKFHLHPIEPAHDFGPVLLKREYVEKILDLHCVGDKYKLVNTIANAAWNRQTDVAGSGTVDYFMVHTGRTYCLPLITINANFGSFENDSIVQKFYRSEGDIIARNVYYFWWQHEKDKFTLDEFFSFGSKEHNEMMISNPQRYRNYDITGKGFKMYGEMYLDYFRN